jgi:hypothetical protein
MFTTFLRIGWPAANAVCEVAVMAPGALLLTYLMLEVLLLTVLL